MWVKDTRATRIRQTVFFKHKYLTQFNMTDANALVQAADELSGVLQNAEVNALVEIFKSRAEMEQGPTDERHKMRAAAQSQRVQTEEDGMPQRVTVLESAV